MATKTNCMRILDQHKIDYRVVSWDQDYQDAWQGIVVFKTLVSRGQSGKIYVFVLPLKDTLDLKKAARVTGEKNIHMLKEKELLPLTGYVHGGCSCIGMKKSYPTWIDNQALDSQEIIFSAGQVGLSVCLDPRLVAKTFAFEFADVCKDKDMED